MLSLAVHAVSSALSERVGSVAVRRIQPEVTLPWIYEADWAAQKEIDTSVGDHDPLSSCFWPASLPLAKLIAGSTARFESETVCELGCGTGLESLAAASAGASNVVATDVDPLSLALTAAAAAAQQLKAVQTLEFDVFDGSVLLPKASILLLSDLFVTSALARAHARRVAEALHAQSGFKLVLVVDPNRTTRACFLDELAVLGVQHDGFRPADGIELTSLRGPAAHAQDAQSQCELVLLSTEDGAAVWFEI